MALIKCPECGKGFSDKADKCPSCGYSTKNIEREVFCPECGRKVTSEMKNCPECGYPLRSQKKKRKKKKTGIASGLLIAVFVVILILFASLVTIIFIANKNNNESMSETVARLVDKGAEEDDAQSQSVYEIGQTWEVDGQWKLTINSITETQERNEYEERNPSAVYVIDYTYENIGYEDKDGIMDGLFIDLSLGQIVDSKGTMGYSYPGNQKSVPKEIPVGANLTADVPIGVDNAGNFTVTISAYDGNQKEQEATFNCVVK